MIGESVRQAAVVLVRPRVLGHVMRRGAVWGFCPICEQGTVFYHQGPWARDDYLCQRCRSIPRARALIAVLAELFPNWRHLIIHESSPGGASSYKLRQECRQYLPTHYFPGVAPGQVHNGFRCEDLEAQTFADASFDLVITQDVFEHVLDPQRAFAEIARTLRPGGAHVFTVPWYAPKPTVVRATRDGGGVRHLLPPDYHRNPIDPQGSLVVTEWGSDLCDIIYRVSGMTTKVVRLNDRRRGLEAEFLEVFVSRKPDAAAPADTAARGAADGRAG